MYAVAIIRYRRPLDEVLAVNEKHRAYLHELKAQGVLLVSGPMDPRTGGIAIFKISDDGDVVAALDRIRDADPYVMAGVAQYEMIQWNVGIGKEDLEKIGQ
jgi:uncharacterized protein YciI